MARAKSRLFLRVALATMTVAVSPAAARAQEADRTIALAIPAQSLSGALRQLAEASGLQLVYDARITDDKTAPALSGPMTGRAAVAQLLAGSGLSFAFSGDRTVIITAAAANEGIRSIGVVNVEGASGAMPYGALVSPVNGINGSRDVEATEGTGSYTTGATSIVSKTPQSLRETPESVSVMTAQRIHDLGLNNIEDVLQQLPGITSTPGVDSSDFNIYSRGFQVTNFSIDGGTPVTYQAVRPIIDMSEYDSVQLIRGANSLFGGYSDPGGTVNLVRKKPLDHDQFTYQQQIGSYSAFHEEADVTGPLTSDRHLRARLVVSQNNQKYYYDIAKSFKTSVYGIVEYDLTPKTLIAFGASYLRQANTTNQGLPRYLDGSTIDFPTSTCLCLPFAQDRATKKELFAIVNRVITDRISAKLNLTYNEQSLNEFFYGTFSQIPLQGTPRVVLDGERSITPIRDFLVDFAVNGSFKLFDRTNQFLVGGSYDYRNQDGARTDIYFPIPLLSDVFHFDPSQYQDPSPDISGASNTVRSRTKLASAYANLRLEIFKNLHFITGIKYSYYDLSQLNAYPDGSGGLSYSAAPPLEDKSHSSPSVAATYDFLRSFTVYGSHQITYQPQAYSRYTQTATIPPPITGSNDEIGLKWQSPDKKTNASIALYNITQNHILFTDPNDFTQRVDSQTNRKSRGVDVEVTGELLPQVQGSISYTYNNNTYNTPGGTTPNASFSPRSEFKAWMVYRGAPDSWAARVIAGLGVESQTSSYNSGYICGVLVTDVNAACPSYINYHFTTKGYTTLGLKLGYQLNRHIELSVKGSNITNIKTYASSRYQAVYGYNFYVPPFNILASINAKW